MYVLDNLLRDKYLEDITIFLEKHKIKNNTFLLEGIVVNLTFKINCLEIRKEYRNLYQRQITILEILSDKQGLPSDITLAFRIVRENLRIQHIISPINTYLWYKIYKEKRLPNYLLTQIVL